MSKKKIIINIVLLVCIICTVFQSICVVYAEDFNEVNFTVTNTEEDYIVYLLLPESYIKYINNIKGLNHNITSIPGNEQAIVDYINYFDVNATKKDLYEENGIKYLQVELTNVAHNFTFYIAPGYKNMDFKLRYTSNTKDVILHLSSFSYNVDGECRVIYDYSSNEFKTNDEIKESVNKYIVILAILLIVMCIVNMVDDKGKVKSVRKN